MFSGTVATLSCIGRASSHPFMVVRIFRGLGRERGSRRGKILSANPFCANICMYCLVHRLYSKWILSTKTSVYTFSVAFAVPYALCGVVKQFYISHTHTVYDATWKSWCG